MKNVIMFTLALLFSMTSQSYAQRGHNHNRHYDDRHHNDRYYDDRNYHTADCDRGCTVDHYASRQRISKKQRRKLERLYRDLANCRNRAWRDGYISRRERREINELQYRISKIRNGYNYRNSYYSYSYNYRRRSCG